MVQFYAKNGLNIKVSLGVKISSKSGNSLVSQSIH